MNAPIDATVVDVRFEHADEGLEPARPVTRGRAGHGRDARRAPRVGRTQPRRCTPGLRVEGFHNRTRLHGATGHRMAMQFERQPKAA
jgi:hypothetical protein